MTLLLAAALFFQPQSAPPVDPPTPGTVSVQPMAEDAAPPEIRRVFAEAVERALLDANFVALPGEGRGRYIARIGLSREARGAVSTEGRAERTEGYAGNWGAALSVPLSRSGAQVRTLVVTELTVELVAREDDAVVWRGRALTIQPEGTARDAPPALAKSLAGAVMRSFPETLEEAVSVP